jgi:hypothetical protein
VLWEKSAIEVGGMEKWADGVGLNKYGIGWRTDDWLKIKEKLGRVDKGNLFIAFPLLRSNKKDRGT